MEHFNDSTLARSGRACLEIDRAMGPTGKTGCFSRPNPHGDGYVTGLKTDFLSSGTLVPGMLYKDTRMVAFHGRYGTRENLKKRSDDL